MVCGGLPAFQISPFSLPIVPNSGGGLWWFAVVCGSVCGSLWWFAMVCRGLSYSDSHTRVDGRRPWPCPWAVAFAVAGWRTPVTRDDGPACYC